MTPPQSALYLFFFFTFDSNDKYIIMKNIIYLLCSVLLIFSAEAHAQYNIYSYGQYGQKQKAATTQQNYNGGTDIYTYGQYGQKQKAATTQQNYNGDTDVYTYGQYGQKQKTRTYVKNYSGAYDVYEYGQYGQKVKIGTVDKKPNG